MRIATAAYGWRLDSLRQKIAPATRILRAFVGFPLDMFDDGEVRRAKRLSDSAWDMKPEVQRHRCTVEIIHVDHLVSDMEGDQCQAARLQDPPHFPQDGA